MGYSYYDSITNYYYEYYDYYYEYIYWPRYYGQYNVSEDHFCDNMFSTSAPLDGVTSSPCIDRYLGTYPPSPYVYDPWWHKIIHQIGYFLLFPLSSTCFILSIGITILFFVQLRRAIGTPNAPHKIIIGIASFAMCTHTIYNVVETFWYYTWFFNYSSSTIYALDITWETFWTLSKLSIYSLFAYRYYLLSAGSVYSQMASTRKMCIFGSVIASIMLQIVLEIIYGLNWYAFMNAEWDDPQYKEKREGFLSASWAVLTVDFCLVVFLGIMITTTILRLIVRLEAVGDKAMLQRNARTSSQPSAASSKTDQTKDDTVSALEEASKRKAARSKVTSRSEERHKRSKQMDLVLITTKICLTCFLALLTSVFTQLIWLIFEEKELWEYYWLTSFWEVDAWVNMFCIYLSMGFARNHYQRVCVDGCRCHRCCLWFVMKAVNEPPGNDNDVELGTKMDMNETTLGSQNRSKTDKASALHSQEHEPTETET